MAVVQGLNDFQSIGGIRGDQSLGHRGGRTRGQGRDCGATTAKSTKGKNFVPDEERQLARSVLAISQDPIVGNQQKTMHSGRGFMNITKVLIR